MTIQGMPPTAVIGDTEVYPDEPSDYTEDAYDELA